MKDTEEGGEMGSIYISSEQIIQEVQKFRCLYDPSHPDHKDRDVMRDAWLSVTQAVVGEPWANLNSAEKNEAEKDLKKKWKDMRDTFVKSLKKESSRTVKEGRPGIFQTKRSYVHHKPLSFLLQTDHYKEYLSGLPNYTPRPPGSLETVGRPNEAARPRQDFRSMQQKDNAYERDDSCQSSFTAPHQNPEADNADRMFLLSLLPRLTALDNRDKMDFQIGIMQLLQGYEAEDSTS